MNIYFSGISGTGIGPLALFSKDAGLNVYGSDKSAGSVNDNLSSHGISFQIGSQNGDYLQEIHKKTPIDWFIYTSALPLDHPELVLAKKLGIKTSKRDDFTKFLIDKFNLKLIAIAGTHGKTTTTSMAIWAFQKLNIPISYIVGTNLSFAPSGKYNPDSKYIVYECDEYDKNFIKFFPFLSLIPTISYDHPDIYKSKTEYLDTFAQFIKQSSNIITWKDQVSDKLLISQPESVTKLEQSNPHISLPGTHNRKNATLVYECIKALFPKQNPDNIIQALNTYPGSNRRFEKLADGLYTDYAHHPEEIAATLQMAKEVSDKIAVIYQPHQNTRQHQVKHLYKDSFKNADLTVWLPTYLVREDQNLPILSQDELIKELGDSTAAQKAQLDGALIQSIKELLVKDYTVILMTAGPADNFIRQNLDKITN